MPLEPGTSLGPYQITGSLGAGGMGEVYRARDTKLERDVAIKVLPDDLAADPDRLARFEREAKLLAALSHANIGAIHGLEEDEGVRFLVLELIEGESLERRVQRGAIPVPEALDIARQIAEALEAAHDAGIIHRDVKPANVLLTAKGGVKVLDFGIAKSTLLDGAANAALTEQATSLTIDGTLMGTPPYMAPEQIRGEEADKRADIWAFGCVVYEMLTGRGAFARETVADTLVAVLEQEPDGGGLPGGVVPGVTTVLQRCLRKDPNRRLRDLGDARIEIEEIGDGRPALAPRPHTSVGAETHTWRRLAPWVLAAVMGLLAILFWYEGTDAPASEPLHVVALPADSGFPSGANNVPHFAVSPDGSQIVYRGRLGTGEPGQLLVRSLDSLYGVPLSEVGSGFAPFYSPEGRWIGFVQGREILKAPATGGAPLPIVEMPFFARGTSWGPDGMIVIGGLTDALWHVPAEGGAAGRSRYGTRHHRPSVASLCHDALAHR